MNNTVRRIYFIGGVLSASTLIAIVQSIPLVEHKWVALVVIPLVLCSTVIWNIKEDD
jgi:hypothetical protein